MISTISIIRSISTIGIISIISSIIIIKKNSIISMISMISMNSMISIISIMSIISIISGVMMTLVVVGVQETDGISSFWHTTPKLHGVTTQVLDPRNRSRTTSSRPVISPTRFVQVVGISWPRL